MEAEGDRMRDANARLAEAATMKERVLAVREAMVAALEAGSAEQQVGAGCCRERALAVRVCFGKCVSAVCCVFWVPWDPLSAWATQDLTVRPVGKMMSGVVQSPAVQFGRCSAPSA